jgi:8-amino-7-oxononanoate synthase
MTTQQRGLNGTIPHYRNTGKLIDYAGQYFAAAHHEGLMALYARPLPGRSVELTSGDQMGQRIVDFVRCSYLGLDNHPKVIEGALKAVEEAGTLHWSCARTRLNFELLGNLEEALSGLFNAHVIVYSTVLAANMGALPLLASGHLTQGEKPVMVFDRLAHATLAFHKGTIAQETDVITINHNDLDKLEEVCRKNRSVAYICDGVYSMGGAAPLDQLLELQTRYGLFLYIDDAHGISLFGDKGQGYARSHIPDDLGERTIIAASLGKGFGSSGGLLMLGTDLQAELFRQFSLPHAFSASPNLAAVGAAMASEALHRSPELGWLQKQLRARIHRFDQLYPTPFAHTDLPIRVVEVGDEIAAIAAGKTILNKGCYTSAVFFPTVGKGRAGLRICPTASHSDAEISALCRCLEDAIDQTSV